MASSAPRDPRDRGAYARQVVVEYLRKCGYNSTEKALHAEASAEVDATYDDESRNAVMILDRVTEGYDEQPMLYEDMYRELRDWAHGSLDFYKGELHSVLYPHLVHCFLEMVRRGAAPQARKFLEKYGEEFMANSPTCAKELRSLMGVSSPQIMAENETAKLFLNNRFELMLSSYALELLLAFLTDNPRRYLLLRILNHKCRIIDQTLPTVGSGLDERTGFLASQEQSALVTNKEILWGTLKEKEYIISDEQDEDKEEKKDEDGDEEEEEAKPPHVEADGTLSESLVSIPKYHVGAPGLDNFGVHKNRFQESSVRVWDYKSGTMNGTKLVGHSGPVYSVDLSFCGRYVLSGSEDGTVRLWSLPLRADLVAYRGHNHPVWSVAWSPFGHYFASGSHDSTARIWSTDRISPLRILSGHLSDVDAVTWHPNCNYIATGSSDSTARLWDVRKGECVRVFGTHPGTLHALAFSPNGRYLAMSGHTRDIHVWDIAEGKQVQRLKGHEASVWDLSYSTDGAVLASGSADNTVRVWDARLGGVGKAVPTSGTGGVAAGTGAAGGGGRPAPASAASTAASAQTPAAPKATPTPSTATVSGAPTASTATATATTTAAAASAAASNPTVGTLPTHAATTGKDESPLLVTLRTKKTPVYYVQFTRKNLLVASGAYGC